MRGEECRAMCWEQELGQEESPVTFPVLQGLEEMASVWLSVKEHAKSLKEAVGVQQLGWQLVIPEILGMALLTMA